MNIAETILEQLGGNKFLVMTGAKNLVNHGDALSFKLPYNFAKGGINYVKIYLCEDDTYSVKFGKVNRNRAWDWDVLSEVDYVYADMLPETFTKHTGLEVSL